VPAGGPEGSRTEAGHQHQRGEDDGDRLTGLAELPLLAVVGKLAGEPVHQFLRWPGPLRPQTRFDVAFVLTGLPESPHRAPSDRMGTLIYRVRLENLTDRSSRSRTIAAAIRRGRATPRPRAALIRPARRSGRRSDRLRSADRSAPDLAPRVGPPPPAGRAAARSYPPHRADRPGPSPLRPPARHVPGRGRPARCARSPSAR